VSFLLQVSLRSGLSAQCSHKKLLVLLCASVLRSSFLPGFLFVDFPGAVFHSCWITSFGACGPASSSIARVLLALGCLPLRVLGLFTAARARCLLPALLLLLDSLPPVLIFGSCARAFWFFSCRSVSAVQAPS
jgi:hypothetical protein